MYEELSTANSSILMRAARALSLWLCEPACALARENFTRFLNHTKSLIENQNLEALGLRVEFTHEMKFLKEFVSFAKLRIEFFVIQKQKDYKVKYAMAAGLLNIMTNYRTSLIGDEI